MSSYQYRIPLLKIKGLATVLSLTWESPYPERRFAYWDGALNALKSNYGFVSGYWQNISELWRDKKLEDIAATTMGLLVVPTIINLILDNSPNFPKTSVFRSDYVSFISDSWCVHTEIDQYGQWISVMGGGGMQQTLWSNKWRTLCIFRYTFFKMRSKWHSLFITFYS